MPAALLGAGTITSAQAGATNWPLSSKALNANGCTGGSHGGTSP